MGWLWFHSMPWTQHLDSEHAMDTALGFRACHGHRSWIQSMQWTQHLDLDHSMDTAGGFRACHWHGTWIRSMPWTQHLNSEHAMDIALGFRACHGHSTWIQSIPWTQQLDSEHAIDRARGFRACHGHSTSHSSSVTYLSSELCMCVRNLENPLPLPTVGGGTPYSSRIRHCVTSRKVAGSIPDGVIWIFHWHNPSARTMALGSTQLLTARSPRTSSVGGEAKAAGA
jgi:hypothetical protein